MIAHPRVDLKLLTQDGMTADQVAVEQNAHASFLDFLPTHDDFCGNRDVCRNSQKSSLYYIYKVKSL